LKSYSIQEDSELLKMPKDTLRCYDRLKLVSPSRGENKYRYYTEQNAMDLRYIGIMKCAEFTLAEIRQFFSFKCSRASAEDCDGIEQLLEDKKLECKQKIEAYTAVATLLDKMLNVKRQIKATEDMALANDLVNGAFQQLRGELNEK
jgi:DNA-binding transcriptional MerR regulator